MSGFFSCSCRRLGVLGELIVDHEIVYHVGQCLIAGYVVLGGALDRRVPVLANVAADDKLPVLPPGQPRGYSRRPVAVEAHGRQLVGEGRVFVEARRQTYCIREF